MTPNFGLLHCAPQSLSRTRVFKTFFPHSMNSIFCRWVLLVTVSVLPSALVGCTDPDFDDSTDPNHSQPMTSWQGSAAEAAPLPSPEETLNTALILGDRADQAAHSAQTTTDWEVAAARFEQALNLLKAIPPSSEHYSSAQAKIQDYDAKLQESRRRLTALRPES